MEDQKVDEEAATIRPAEPAGPALQWPPPGLERLQGDIWQITRTGMLAAIILVFPLLLVISTPQEFWSLGPLGNTWWVILIPMVAGASMILEALFALARLLRRSSRALERGYHWKIVADVACDARRDTGFLLQGARWFSELDERARRQVARLRLASAGLQLTAVLWLATGFAVGLLLAARGTLDERALTVFTIAPAATLFLLGVGTRATEGWMVRRARGRWFRQPWSEQLELSEVEKWQSLLRNVSGTDERPDLARPSRILRYLVIGVGLLGTLILFPLFALAPTSAIGPIMASVAVPRFTQTQERAARAEAFRLYRVPTTDETTAAQAGQLLQTLMFVGRSDQPALGEVAPGERYSDPWFPGPLDEPAGPTEIAPRLWGTDLLPDAAQLSPDVLVYLDSVASHGAHEEFSRLASSPQLDVVFGRWSLPSSGLGMATLPIPRSNRLRLGGQAHIGKAIHQLALGDAGAAELTIREVISVGFLLVEDAPTMIDNLLGFGLISLGGEALEALFETMGRTTDLVALRQARDATARAARLLEVSGSTSNLESVMSQLPAIAASPESLRGMRWEFFTLTNTLSPCLNLNRVVFGPDADYERWVETVRSSLVRFPSEAELFDLALRGYFGAASDTDRPSGLGRLLTTAMGGAGAPGSCSGVFQRLSIGR